MTNNKKIIISSFILATLNLTGCSSVLTDDLNKFMDEAKKQKATVPEIPKIIEVARIDYIGTAQEIKDPFINISSTVEIEGPEIRPDQDRRKEFLEGFDLLKMSLMGTIINKNKTIDAIVKLEDGTLYLVKEGNYLGLNYGKINSISETEINLTETIQDEAGKWIEKPNKLSLVDSNQQKDASKIKK